MQTDKIPDPPAQMQMLKEPSNKRLARFESAAQDFDAISASSLNTDFRGAASNAVRVQSQLSDGMAAEVIKMLAEMNKKIENITDK